MRCKECGKVVRGRGSTQSLCAYHFSIWRMRRNEQNAAEREKRDAAREMALLLLERAMEPFAAFGWYLERNEKSLSSPSWLASRGSAIKGTLVVITRQHCLDAAAALSGVRAIGKKDER